MFYNIKLHIIIIMESELSLTNSTVIFTDFRLLFSTSPTHGTQEKPWKGQYVGLRTTTHHTHILNSPWISETIHQTQRVRTLVQNVSCKCLAAPSHYYRFCINHLNPDMQLLPQYIRSCTHNTPSHTSMHENKQTKYPV